MAAKKPSSVARHPIGVVSSRTGLPLDVLRAWERRYAAVVPTRTDTGRRLYSDLDVERLRALRVAVDQGRRISDVASLSLAKLQALQQEDEASRARSRRIARRRPKAEPAEYVTRGFAAVESLDRDQLVRVLEEAEVALDRLSLYADVLVPLLRRIGECWREGTLRIVNEHVATDVFRGFLARHVAPPDAPTDRPRLIVTTAAGQLHELGALLVAATARDHGWEPAYLGPNLPAEEIAAGVERYGARALALSLVYPVVDPRLDAELENLRHYVGSEFPIFVGGDAARAHAETLKAIRARYVASLADLGPALAGVAA
ncbi:MAG: MerR family transcriptional regulator [bacterium]